MKADQLLDSRKLNMILDDFAATWSKKRADPKDKEIRFQALLDYLEPMFSQQPVAVSVTQTAPAPKDLRTMNEAEFNAPIPKTTPEQHLAEFDGRVNRTINLIRERCDSVPSGSLFRVHFPSSGEWELADLNGLCQAVGLPCQVTESGMMGFDNGGMLFEFVKA